MDTLTSWGRIGVLLGAAMVSLAQAATPVEQLAGYEAQAGAAAQPARGQQFFTSRHGQEWSCASCHASMPGAQGRHASTGKTIAPLAPAFNPQRFTDEAKTEKWFKRNCNDVLAWLLTLKP